MKIKYLPLLLTLVFFSASVVSAQDVPPPDDFVLQIENQRMQKNMQFRDPGESPLSADSIDNFEGLSYFPVEINFKISGTIVPLDEQAPMKLATSSGKSLELINYGTVIFAYEGKYYELLVFQNNKLPEFTDQPNQLFIPFFDQTSGVETNKTGRYLKINLPLDSNKVELDFNQAFNPYSAYNPKYEGVIPPEPNSLILSVTSGERKYEDR